MKADSGWKLKENNCLYPSQVDVYENLHNKLLRKLDSSKCGVGKSFPALTSIIRNVYSGVYFNLSTQKVSFRSQVNGLIIAPKSAWIGWQDSIAFLEVSDKIKFVNYSPKPSSIPTKIQTKKIQADIRKLISQGYSVILLMSWGMFSRASFMEDLSWIQLYLKPEHIIADECQFISGDSTRANNFRYLWSRAYGHGQYPMVSFLSATPIHMGPHKAYPLFACIFQSPKTGFNSIFPNGKEDFEVKFFPEMEMNGNRIDYGPMNNLDYFKRLFSYCSKTYTREQVIKNRRKPLYNTIKYKEDKGALSLCQAYIEMYRERTHNQFPQASTMVQRRLLTCPEYYGLPENPLRFEILLDILKNGEIHPGVSSEKIVILTEFTHTNKKLCEKLNEKGYISYYVNGSCSDKERKETFANFEQKGQILVLQRQITTGLNLQHANWVINYELGFSSDSFEQGVGRIDRHGQTEQMYIVTIVAQATYEIRILRKLYKRLNLAYAAMSLSPDPISNPDLSVETKKILTRIIDEEIDLRKEA